MTTAARWWLVGLSLLLVGCGSKPAAISLSPLPSTPAVESRSPEPAASDTPAPPASLSVTGSRYGRIIADSAGRTLYMFDAEAGPSPKCYGPCAAAWPPLLATGTPVSGPGLSQALIAAASRSDGSQQITYNGHPLYYYVGDRAPGEIGCQAVFEFGGGWFVVDDRGSKITSS